MYRTINLLTGIIRSECFLQVINMFSTWAEILGEGFLLTEGSRPERAQTMF